MQEARFTSSAIRVGFSGAKRFGACDENAYYPRTLSAWRKYWICSIERFDLSYARAAKNSSEALNI